MVGKKKNWCRRSSWRIEDINMMEEFLHQSFFRAVVWAVVRSSEIRDQGMVLFIFIGS